MPVSSSSNQGKVEQLRSKLESLSSSLTKETLPQQPMPTHHHRAAPHSSKTKTTTPSTTNNSPTIGSLHLQIRREQRRVYQAEENLRRVEIQRDYHHDKAKHLQQALKERDGKLMILEDHVRDLEISSVTAQELEEVQVERDELKATVTELREKLTTSTEILANIESESNDFRRQLASLAEIQAENSRLRRENKTLQQALEDSTETVIKLQRAIETSTRHVEQRRMTLLHLTALGESLGPAITN